MGTLFPDSGELQCAVISTIIEAFVLLTLLAQPWRDAENSHDDVGTTFALGVAVFFFPIADHKASVGVFVMFRLAGEMIAIFRVFVIGVREQHCQGCYREQRDEDLTQVMDMKGLFVAMVGLLGRCPSINLWRLSSALDLLDLLELVAATGIQSR